MFFPLLKREAFEQEGHRLEFEENGDLVRAGVVLNEMKGSYSSVESVAGDWTLRSLFPDSPYGWDSGGDPEHIPSLTYEAFRAFHAEWYHPSNSRIFLYGNHDLDEVLSILDGEFLSRFDYRDIKSEIPLQPRWNEPRYMETFWPSSPEDSADRKTTISVNWLLGESTDPLSVLSSQVLSFILLGHGGAPLQKAIVDSGLGEDVSPVSGLETELRQMVFSAALRGTDADSGKAFEDLVTATLEKAVSGLDADLIEGALRTVEFRAREIRGGSPFGMRLMKRALRGWLHGRPPLESLAFKEPMAELRRRGGSGDISRISSGGISWKILTGPRSRCCPIRHCNPDATHRKKRVSANSARLSLRRILNGLNPLWRHLMSFRKCLTPVKIWRAFPFFPVRICRETCGYCL